MEEKHKKVIFTEEERLFLRDCVLASKVLTSVKKTDNVSNIAKAKAWEEVTRNFNSQTKNIPRTVNQLKKLWENIKFRRKMELANAKRNSNRTSDNYSPSFSAEDPAVDPLGGIDMELNADDVVDSDSILSASYVVSPQGSLTPILEMKQESKDSIKKEAELRVTRLSNQIIHDQELHELRMKEARVRFESAEAELELVKLKKEVLLKDLNKNIIFR